MYSRSICSTGLVIVSRIVNYTPTKGSCVHMLVSSIHPGTVSHKVGKPKMKRV